MRRAILTLVLPLAGACNSTLAPDAPILFEVTEAAVVADLVSTPTPSYHVTIPYRVENRSSVPLRVADCGTMHVEKVVGGEWARVTGPVSICSLMLRAPLAPGAVLTDSFTVAFRAAEPPGGTIAGSYRLETGFTGVEGTSMSGIARSNLFQVVAEP